MKKAPGNLPEAFKNSDWVEGLFPRGRKRLLREGLRLQAFGVILDLVAFCSGGVTRLGHQLDGIGNADRLRLVATDAFGVRIDALTLEVSRRVLRWIRSERIHVRSER